MSVILSRISVAARTALAHPRNVELANFIGAGPSIRARARLALIAAFLVAAPTLFVGVMRTENVAEHAALLSEYDDYWKEILHARLMVQNLDVALLTYILEREFENAQAAILAIEQVRAHINLLVAKRPEKFDLGPEGFFESLVGRLDGLIKRSIANLGSMAPARLGVISLTQELISVEKRVILKATRERKLALTSLSTVSRDQLILFLVLLFAMPVFVGFVPGWLIAPMVRLRQIASKVELGQLKDLAITGRDEVATLGRALKTYLLRKEELEHKKSAKIFEMRNVLRSVINRVAEPVFIVDSNSKINYTNEAAAQKLGLPTHQMEGKTLADCMYAPTAQKAVDLAFSGDVNEDPIDVKVEASDGRNYAMQAKIGTVRNRDGEVSRAVLVLYDSQGNI